VSANHVRATYAPKRRDTWGRTGHQRRQEERCVLPSGRGGWRLERLCGSPVARDFADANSFLGAGLLTAQNRERRDGGDWGAWAMPHRLGVRVRTPARFVMAGLPLLGSLLEQTPSSMWGFSPPEPGEEDGSWSDSMALQRLGSSLTRTPSLAWGFSPHSANA
jgi:hypothetical protein